MKEKNGLKKTLAVFLVVVLLLTTAPLAGFVGLDFGAFDLFSTTAQAASTYTEGSFTYTVADGKATITDCSTSISGELVIPETLGGYPVTIIGSSAFEDCTGLTSITIPDSVTSIGWDAFSFCTGLTSITIPDSITSIGSSAFYNTAWYNAQPFGDVYAGKVYYKYKGTMPENTSVEIKDGTKGIADSAFRGCNGLVDINIPNGVTNIGDDAFYSCNELTDINIPDSVTSIGSSAFESCTGLTIITIGDSVTSIGDYAFRNCTGLTSVTIGNSVTSIGYSAFCGCTGLTSVTIGNSVASIDRFAFYGCTGLTKISWNAENVSDFSYDSNIFSNAGTAGDGIDVVFGDSVKSIPEDAFCPGYNNNQPNIKSVTIGNSVTSIGGSAFSGCTGLTSITIPDSVTSIGGFAFYGCTGLTKINWNAENVSDFRSNDNVFSNAGTAGDGIDVVFGDSVKSIPKYAFFTEYDDNQPNIKSVTIGNSVTSIGSYAFRNCTSLTSITIPDSVASIGCFAFSGCTGLTSITIPDGVTSIGSSAFDNTAWYNAQPFGDVYAGKVYYKYKGTMPENTSVEIKDGTKGIAGRAFSGCNGLVDINIPNGVTNIGDEAFYSCNELTDINIPDSVTSIGSSAFSDCTGLTSVTIPDSVTSIGGSAF